MARAHRSTSGRLGHASAKVTLDVYGHLFPDEEDHTRAAIDTELGERRDRGAVHTGSAGS